MRRDILSAYAASAAKSVSWFIASAFLFRVSDIQFAMFALVRGTIGLLNYTSFGIAPAMVRMIAEARSNIDEFPEWIDDDRSEPRADDPNVLSYRTAEPSRWRGGPELPAYSNGVVVASVSAVMAGLLVLLYAQFFGEVHDIGDMSLQDLRLMVLAMGTGMILRLVSDVPGAVLQASDRISLDNHLLTAGECLWILLIITCALPSAGETWAVRIAQAYAIAAAALLFLRWRACVDLMQRATPDWSTVNWQAIGNLLSFGVLVTFAQLADFLYAPTDFILINRFVRADAVAIYAPAVQIDSGLLLLVMAIANVLFPKTALAHVAGDTRRVRQYYLHGTAASAGLLLIVSVVVWALSPWLFRMWLGYPIAATQQILPLVLIHTVIGGSSAVGRSILLGMGKVKPFTIAVLMAGVSNVILSYVFVRYLHLGLRGIIYGTIIAVVGRCAIWMPWYVLRSLRDFSHPSDPFPA